MGLYLVDHRPIHSKCGDFYGLGLNDTSRSYAHALQDSPLARFMVTYL
jgi:hypothetical protein